MDSPETRLSKPVLTMSDSPSEIRLTQFSKGAGCGCKIAPDTLEQILGAEALKFIDPALLVGNSSRDDAAVLDIGNGRALISTTDFFTPIVDDPYDFGRIAATNSLSDVYAMGGKPVLALAILGWPLDKISPEHASTVLAGARKVCKEAGITIAGGHSIDVPEPIFGLAVNGLVDKNAIKQNSTAQPGDKLYLTKPLGLGILSTAMKRGLLDSEAATIATNVMCQLNDVGYELAQIEGVNAMTDITGFGLLGHLIEMCESSQLGAHIIRNNVPIIPAAIEYLSKGCYPDGTFRNWRSYGTKTVGCEGNDMLLFSDPQTSGGLLIAISESASNEVETNLQKHSIPYQTIGTLSLRGVSGSPCVSVS